MQIKNLTPLLFGTRVTSRHPPEPEMVAVVRGTFAIRPGGRAALPEADPIGFQGALTGEVYEEDDDERAGECLYPDDFAEHKANAEVMLRGACHAPGGEPVRECPVRFSVGGWSKILHVVGPRVWGGGLLGGAPTEPVPFTRMELGWRRAFGGADYAANPVGKGIATSELPNVEHAGERVRARGDRLAPAGFGPIAASWTPRRGKHGKAYGKDWVDKRAPFYAEDFDWSFFHSAPADQQLSGFLHGDEALVFHNLHPTIPILTTHLPALRVRVFVRDAAGEIREVRMNLDTLFADMSRETITLTWRGHLQVAAIDLADVDAVVIGSEPLDERLRPDDHYRGVFARLDEDPLAIDEHVAEELRDIAKKTAYGDTRAQPAAKPADPALDPVSALLQEKLGRLAPAEQRRVRAAMARLLAAPPPPQANTSTRQALDDAMSQRRGPASVPLAPPRPGVVPIRDARIREALRGARARLEADPRARDEALRDERFAALCDDAAREAPEPGPGVDLSGCDLSGRDLRGRDLRGANLEGAILEGANLQNANLAGARLVTAVLADADLRGADLTDADLSRANARGARAAGAIFRRARLDDTSLERADLEGADLSGSQGDMTMLSEVVLTGAKICEARFTHAVARAATLTRLDARGATLVRCMLLSCVARQARFDDATLTHTSFGESDLSEASFVGARAERAIFLRAVLGETDLRWADLSFAQLHDAQAVGARLHGANLKGAQLYRATLRDVDATRANFAGASFMQATLDKTRFNDANLYEANLFMAAGTGCDFTGANLRRSSFERS